MDRAQIGTCTHFEPASFGCQVPLYSVRANGTCDDCGATTYEVTQGHWVGSPDVPLEKTISQLEAWGLCKSPRSSINQTVFMDPYGSSARDKHCDACDNRESPSSGKPNSQPAPPNHTLENASDAQLLSFLYDEKSFIADLRKKFLSLGQLPHGSSHKSESGYGWGRYLDRILGGGVCPGYLLGVGGLESSDWLMQLVDGLALRNSHSVQWDGNEPLTPVLLASTRSAASLTLCSLSRWIGFEYRSLRSLHRIDEVDPLKSGINALGHLREARSWIRLFQGGERGSRMVTRRFEDVLSSWVVSLQKQYPSRTIWPIVVLDTIQHFQDANGVETLDGLVDCLASTAKELGWTVMLTLEGSSEPRGETDFRSAGKLLDVLDAALYLRSCGDSQESELELKIIKNDWGTINEPPPRYRWEPKFARFDALSEYQISERVERRPTRGRPRRSTNK